MLVRTWRPLQQRRHCARRRIVDTLAFKPTLSHRLPPPPPPPPPASLAPLERRTPQRNREFLGWSFFSVTSFYGEERAGFYGEEDWCKYSAETQPRQP